MTLSERERRELDLIEQALADDYPRLARRMRSRYAESLAMATVFGLAILAAVVSGCVLVVLGDELRLLWLAAVGAALAASAPFLACWWAVNRHGWRRR